MAAPFPVVSGVGKGSFTASDEILAMKEKYKAKEHDLLSGHAVISNEDSILEILRSG